MKIFLDDVRRPPEGWELVRWPEEAIQKLKTGEVTDVSLDHDLGDDSIGNGYDVLLWIEEQIFNNNLILPNISVHSANVSARIKMELAISKIKELHREGLCLQKNKK